MYYDSMYSVASNKILESFEDLGSEKQLCPVSLQIDSFPCSTVVDMNTLETLTSLNVNQVNSTSQTGYSNLDATQTLVGFPMTIPREAENAKRRYLALRFNTDTK